MTSATLSTGRGRARPRRSVDLNKAHLYKMPTAGPLVLAGLGVAGVAVCLTLAVVVKLPVQELLAIGNAVAIAMIAIGLIGLRDVRAHEIWQPTLIKMDKAAEAPAEMARWRADQEGANVEICRQLASMRIAVSDLREEIAHSWDRNAAGTDMVEAVETAVRKAYADGYADALSELTDPKGRSRVVRLPKPHEDPKS